MESHSDLLSIELKLCSIASQCFSLAFLNNRLRSFCAAAAPTRSLFLKASFFLLMQCFDLLSDVRLIIREVNNFLFWDNIINTEMDVVSDSLSGHIKLQVVEETPICTRKAASQSLYTVICPLQHSLIYWGLLDLSTVLYVGIRWTVRWSELERDGRALAL